ncbi:hypothetical protein [Saccharopolyspora dendranthemae]|uniref:Uncharacterized protein n=1 Tax=Saccharopolyspora dendranthemae TaxID=1181886 RepID=A0A561U4Z3_9PSEU|nr:hypothetical protein [Saccharopolyspora dendranthemae]TWF94432.1 hypothetical protein FHU35_13139 [Saccharopolyspora dendranthemae]
MHSKLVEPEVLGESLKNLIESAESWTFHVTRSKLNWDTGKAQQEGLTLGPGDDVKLGNELDPRLAKSRRVSLYITWSDGGAALVNLADRSHREITGSDSLTKNIKEFSNRIKSGATSFTGINFVAFLFLWPFALGIGMAFISSLTDPARRKWLFEPTPEGVRPPLSPWVHEAMSVAILFWPATIIAAALIVTLRAYCGGLRVKRMPITKTSVPLALYKLRSELLRGDIWRPIVTGVVICVFGAIFGYWLK